MSKTANKILKNLTSKKGTSADLGVNFFTHNLDNYNNEPYNAERIEKDFKSIKNNPNFTDYSIEHSILKRIPISCYGTTKSGLNSTNFGVLYPYDKYLYKNGSIIGFRDKEFYILRSKNLFNELFDELQNNPDSAYKTHANKAILEGLRPLSLSCLLLYCNQNVFTCHNEEMASKFLNYLNIPVVYSTTIKIQDRNTKKYYPATLSADFVKEGFTYESIIDHLICAPFDLKEYLSIINSIVEDFNLNHKTKNKMNEYELVEKKKEICNNFIDSYIAREYILGDGDFNYRNIGFLKNHKTGEIELAPNFDLENSFNSTYIAPSNWDLKYIIENYPQNLKRIISKTEQIPKETKNNPYNSEIIEQIPLLKYQSQNECRIISSNLDTLKNYISKEYPLFDLNSEKTREFNA